MEQRQITILVAFIVVGAMIALIGFLTTRKRRSLMLRKRFGPEYDRVVKEQGNVDRGDDILQFREKRREKLQVVALSPCDHSGFEGRWTTPWVSRG